MSLVAAKDIEAGEEILVNYNYELQFAPEWYQELWKSVSNNSLTQWISAYFLWIYKWDDEKNTFLDVGLLTLFLIDWIWISIEKMQLKSATNFVQSLL